MWSGKSFGKASFNEENLESETFGQSQEMAIVKVHILNANPFLHYKGLRPKRPVEL